MKDTQLFAKRVGQSITGYVETSLIQIGDKLGLFKDLSKNGPGTGTTPTILNKEIK